MSRRNLYLGLLVVIALAVFATPFSRLLLSSISEPTYTHILVVGPASISLILLRRASIFSNVRFSVFGRRKRDDSGGNPHADPVTVL